MASVLGETVSQHNTENNLCTENEELKAAIQELKAQLKTQAVHSDR